MKKIIPLFAVFLAAALAVPALASGSTGFAKFWTYNRLEVVLEEGGNGVYYNGYPGTAAELDTALQYACEHPTYTRYQYLAKNRVTSYSSDFSDLHNVKFKCSWADPVNGKSGVYWQAGYVPTDFGRCKYSFLGWSGLTCRGNMIQRFDITHPNFPFPLPE